MKKFLYTIIVILQLVSPLVLVAGEVFYYHTDNFGTPMAMTDKGGKVVWRSDELPFGEEYQTEELPHQNNRRYLGKQLDEETGLICMGARYLDPKTGRFNRPDPVGLVDPATGKINQEMLLNPQRLNRYVYGLNNPYKYIDSDGNFPILGAVLIGAGIAYFSSPDVSNAPATSSASTYESHGGRNIAMGMIGGAGGVVAKTIGVGLISKKLTDGPRVRHHTSIEGVNAIKITGVINPSRGGGVHVETMPFGSSKTASAETGAFGSGAYVEFTAPKNIIGTNVGPRNTGVISTKKPLSIKHAKPKIKKR